MVDIFVGVYVLIEFVVGMICFKLIDFVVIFVIDICFLLLILFIVVVDIVINFWFDGEFFRVVNKLLLLILVIFLLFVC